MTKFARRVIAGANAGSYGTRRCGRAPRKIQRPHRRGAVRTGLPAPRWAGSASPAVSPAEAGARERRRCTGSCEHQCNSRRCPALVVLWERMLTRSQVARRIGKSIATVRRLEGRVLHPLLGDGDVRLFNESEVERLRDKPGDIARWGRSDWFQRRRARQARTSGAPRACAGQSSQEAAAAIVDVLEALLTARPRMLLQLGVDERMMRNLVRAVEAVEGDSGNVSLPVTFLPRTRR